MAEEKKPDADPVLAKSVTPAPPATAKPEEPKIEMGPIIAELKKRFGEVITFCSQPEGSVKLPAPAEGEDAPEPMPHSLTDPLILVDSAEVLPVSKFLKTTSKGKFDYLITVTAADYHPKDRIEVIYQLYSMQTGERLAMKARLPRTEPAIDSVVSVWKAADFPEREVYDLFGVTFKGHPDLRRIFLEDEFEGYPLRKDWDADFFMKLPETGFR